MALKNDKILSGNEGDQSSTAHNRARTNKSNMSTLYHLPHLNPLWIIETQLSGGVATMKHYVTTWMAHFLSSPANSVYSEELLL